MASDTCRRVRAVEAAVGRALIPHPRGLTGRMASAYDDGHDLLADTLMNAALAEAYCY